MGCRAESWALWTARALGLPYTPYASDGASVRTVLDEQIPASRARRGARGPVRPRLPVLGTNDVRGFDWDPFAYEAALARRWAGWASAASGR